MKASIPNFITLLNLFSGCIAVIYALEGNMKLTALFVCIGIFFDFFDGLLARKLKVQSELGVQLDSLADMVTSGLVPGLVLFHLFGLAPQASWDTQGFLPYVGLFVTLASAYRLAKFNISTNQSDSFIGVPTPANALLIISLPSILKLSSEISRASKSSYMKSVDIKDFDFSLDLIFFAVFNIGRKNHCSDDPINFVQLNKPVPFTDLGSKNLTNDFFL